MLFSLVYIQLLSAKSILLPRDAL